MTNINLISNITYEEFLSKIEILNINISRDTFNKLCLFLKLLEEASETMNLVGRSTLPTIWDRHLIDSLQLYPIVLQYLKSNNGVMDIGSGAGFPGIVLAILGVPNVTLVEATKKKCGFLQNVSRETFCSYRVLDQRIEDLVLSQPPAVITARAMAPLEKLLSYTFKWLSKETTGVFPKGETWEDELKTAERHWKFKYEIYPSLTNEKAKILAIHHLKRKR